jgi:enoyl-CoA hydratase/carnithine racemase
MSRKTDLSTLGQFLHLEQYEWGNIVRFHDNILGMADDMYALASFHSLLNDLACRPGVPLAFWGDHGCFSPERCSALLKKLADADGSNKRRDAAPSPLCRLTMMREENVWAGLIRWLRGVKRPTIMVYQGEVALPFLGIGLACDFRIAANDTTFCNHGQDLDMPPLAGLLYLLPAYIGLGRANDLVIRSKGISAHSAHDGGLLNEAVASEELERTLRNTAAELSRFSAETLDTIKHLLNHRLPSVDSYFAVESQGLEKALLTRPWDKITKREVGGVSL